MQTVTRHAYIADELGERIRRLRKERGWTQAKFAERIGCSRRAVVYYERDGKYPPAPVLAAMAGAFQINIEALMDPEEPKIKQRRDDPNLLEDQDDRRLWRRFQQLKALPERDQRAILRMLDTMTAVQAKENEA
jgi:transcriptional regulator with XRE-family HTH domain